MKYCHWCIIEGIRVIDEHIGCITLHVLETESFPKIMFSQRYMFELELCLRTSIPRPEVCFKNKYKALFKLIR